MLRHPKYSNGNIYLSGGMEKAQNLGAEWRKNCSHVLKEHGFYPIDITALDRSYAAQKYGELFYSYKKNFTDTSYLQFKSNIRRHFIYADLELVKKNSDAILVYWDEAAAGGGGTHNEISIAFDCDIPIFVVAGVPKESIPGWLIAQVTKIFDDWESFYEYLTELPKGILCRDVYGNHHAGKDYLCSMCGNPFEKSNSHFVSKISPLYCKKCVEAVKVTYENLVDRYQFFTEYMENEILEQLKTEKS